MSEIGEPTKYCRVCSYVLDGLPGGRCPECGCNFDPEDPNTYGLTAERVELRRWLRRVAILAVVSVPLEVFCAWLAYETISEVMMFLLLFVVVVGNLVAGLFLIIRLPKVTILCMLIVALLLIPHQLFLGFKYCMITHEAKQIVSYLHQTNSTTGEYPPDLSGYQFRFPSTRRHFFGYSPDVTKGGCIIYWFIGNRGTAHRYSPKGGWRYYPD